MAWTLTDKSASVQERMEWIIGAASTQYTKDSLVKMSNGLPANLAGQTDQPYGFVQEMDIQPYNGQTMYNVNGVNTSPLRPATEMKTTTAGEAIGIVPITPGLLLNTDVTPLLNRVAANSNSTTSQALCAYGGSTGDFTGGIVYLPDQDWQGIVTSSAVAGGVVTLVFTPAAPRACTTGDVISAMPFGVGFSPKFDSSNPHLTLSNAVADNSGGNVLVKKVAGQYGSSRGSLFRVTVQIKAPLQ